MRNFLLNLLLTLTSIVFVYVCSEIAFRIYLYDHVRRELNELVIGWMTTGRLYRFNSNTGFDYEPNFTATDFHGFKDEFRINEYGFMANDLDPAHYPIEKPAGEYRIVILGSSFTAGLANYIRWPDLLQDYLNRSPNWRVFVGGKRTRALNFARDGTGFVQWPAVYKFDAQRFSPDLVIVNFLTFNVLYNFVHRGLYNLDGKEAVSRLVENQLLRPLPWYGWYPELLATTMGPLLRLQPRLSAASAYQYYVYFSTQSEAVEQSILALDRIRCMNPNLIVIQQLGEDELFHPEHKDDQLPTVPLAIGLEPKFLQAAKEHKFDVVNLAKLNPMPGDANRDLALFNWPINSHNSDYGVVLYASWMLKYLLERSLTGGPVAPAADASCR